MIGTVSCYSSSCCRDGSIKFHDLINEIDNYIRILNELSEKLDTACADLSIDATNQDRDQEYEQFIEEDNRLATTVIDCINTNTNTKSFIS